MRDSGWPEDGSTAQRIEVREAGNIERLLAASAMSATPTVVTDGGDPVVAIVPVRQGRLDRRAVEEWLSGQYGVALAD